MYMVNEGQFISGIFSSIAHRKVAHIQDINKNRRLGRVQSSSLGLMNPLVFGFLALSDSALAAARKEEV